MKAKAAVLASLAVALVLLLFTDSPPKIEQQAKLQVNQKKDAINNQYNELYEKAHRMLSFQQWQVIFRKTYQSEHELIYRKHVFLQTQRQISNHNKLYESGESLYFKAHNSFSDLTSQEFLAHYSWKHSPHIQPNILTATSQCKGAIMDTPNPPSDKDWGEKVNQMKDPGSCKGKDWAMVAVSTVQSLYALKTGKLPQLSVQQIIQCSQNYGNEGCYGGFMDQAFWYIIDSGIASNVEYPDPQNDSKNDSCKYVSNMRYTGISACARIPSGNYSKLISAIVQSPVSIALNYSPDMQMYKGGVFDSKCDYNLNKAMVLTGFGGKTPSFYWRLRNTVGKDSSWGMNGFIHIIRDGRDGPGKCGLQLWPSVPQNLN